MGNVIGKVRRRILTPSMSEAKLSTRGFHEKDPAARDLLETVGTTFLTGYAFAAEARHPIDAEMGLEQIPRQFRGFAYEGAAMGFAVRDGLPFGGSRHVEQALAGEAARHIYMVYVGVGWAMARVPRFRWSAMHAPDQLLRWLALDGFGFHQAYFQTAKYVHGQYQESNFPWPGGPVSWYSNRAIDQGIGRAMWFVGGTEAARVADMVDGFPEARRADLYAGVGLAATYAGGAGEDELGMLWNRAEKYRRHVAQGSAFAAAARVEAGLATGHTAIATRLFCDTTPQAAADICNEVRPEPVDADIPAYELWRNRIADRFADHAERS
jgi:enediyne biosynthesis protein E3